MLTKRIGCGLLALACLLVAAESIQAQNPMTITGTWTGHENLNGFGRLSFTFHDNGAATMVDAQSTVKGSWTRSGTSVIVTFVNCQYIGALSNTGTVINGVGRFTQGPNQVQWSFNVQR